MKKQNLVSVKQFAKLCKISQQTIYNRIKNGEIVAEELNSTLFIDRLLNPVIGAKSAGRKSAESLLK